MNKTGWITETPSKPAETVEEVLKRIRTTGREQERLQFTKNAEGLQLPSTTPTVRLFGAKCGEHRDFRGASLPEAVIAALDWADARGIRINWV